jgi:hypothetical protein
VPSGPDEAADGTDKTWKFCGNRESSDTTCRFVDAMYIQHFGRWICQQVIPTAGERTEKQRCSKSPVHCRACVSQAAVIPHVPRIRGLLSNCPNR